MNYAQVKAAIEKMLKVLDKKVEDKLLAAVDAEVGGKTAKIKGRSMHPDLLFMFSDDGGLRKRYSWPRDAHPELYDELKPHLSGNFEHLSLNYTQAYTVEFKTAEKLVGAKLSERMRWRTGIRYGVERRLIRDRSRAVDHRAPFADLSADTFEPSNRLNLYHLHMKPEELTRFKDYTAQEKSALVAMVHAKIYAQADLKELFT